MALENMDWDGTSQFVGFCSCAFLLRIRQRQVPAPSSFSFSLCPIFLLCLEQETFTVFPIQIIYACSDCEGGPGFFLRAKARLCSCLGWDVAGIGNETGIPSPMKVTEEGRKSQVLSGLSTFPWWDQLPGTLVKDQRALWLIGKVTHAFSSINRFNG